MTAGKKPTTGEKKTPGRQAPSGGAAGLGDLSVTTPTVRALSVKVKTAKKRTTSSTKWLNRQLNDPYVAEARRQGWRSRAAFKLLQLDERFNLLKPGLRVVDLGAAPGGWTQVALAKVKPEKGSKGRYGAVVALDILPMEPISGAIVLEADFTEDHVPDELKEAMEGPADLVLSDMAAPTTGHPQTDHIRIMALAEMAAQFACEVLTEGGAFVCKLFQGGAEKDLLDLLKRNFKTVKHAKPAASRADSSECYVVAQGFKNKKTDSTI